MRIMEYVEMGEEYNDRQYRSRVVRNLHRRLFDVLSREH